jgi:LPXTG-site transpeptidase (sortase) family protein
VRGRVSAAGAGLVVALGMYVSIGFFTPPATSAKQAVARPEPAAVSVNQPTPSPDRIAEATPERLLIPSIDVDARVEARGLDADRNLATANDYRDVAWYNLGPRPGDPGNAIVNGHVSWWTGDAVFTRLSRLRAGDLVQVRRSDGQLVTFKVTGKKTVDANARIASLFAPSKTATLTLITCTGAWNPLTQTDTQRLLVSATLV